MTTSDPTPGKYDLLLTEAERYHSLDRLEIYGLAGRLTAALRTEQSARQAAEERIDAILALAEQIGNHVASEYDEDRNLDQMILQLRALTAPAESKEPDHE